MSRAIVREQQALLLLGSMNVDERLATFLLDLSQRYAACGGFPLIFNMGLTREELGSLLGMTLETVSRTFSKFQREGILIVKQKVIHFLDHASLKRVVGRAMPRRERVRQTARALHG